MLSKGHLRPFYQNNRSLVLQRDEVDLFECSISEGHIAKEDILELIIDVDGDDNIFDIEG